MKTIHQRAWLVAIFFSTAGSLWADQPNAVDPPSQQLLDEVRALRAEVKELRARVTAPQPATVHLTNAGTSVFRTQADQLGLYLNVRRMGDADPFCELSVHVDASTLPQPPPGVGGAQLVIAPGTSVSVAVTFDTPGTAYDAVSHQVQLCWRLVFTSVRRGDPPEERTFIASWMNHAFVPSLLDAIDRRHLAPAP